MKKLKLVFLMLCVSPIAANAAIPYRAEQTKEPIEDINGKLNDSKSFTRDHKFYVGGMYNFSMWQDADDGVMYADGKNTSAFEVMAGMRFYDTFRLEANFVKSTAEWNMTDIAQTDTMAKLDGNTLFVNAIFDARIDSLYRIFRTQKLIPYVGFGLGISFNSVDDGIKIDNKISPAMAALVGLGIELGDRFALDIGYRYFYQSTPKFDIIDDLSPIAHQLRAGVRVNF